jgi:hypothetical protein
MRASPVLEPARADRRRATEGVYALVAAARDAAADVAELLAFDRERAVPPDAKVMRPHGCPTPRTTALTPPTHLLRGRSAPPLVRSGRPPFTRHVSRRRDSREEFG